MDNALSIVNKVMAILPEFVTMFESILGVDHPAVVDMREATAKLQTAHQAAQDAAPKS